MHANLHEQDLYFSFHEKIPYSGVHNKFSEKKNTCFNFHVQHSFSTQYNRVEVFNWQRTYKENAVSMVYPV